MACGLLQHPNAGEPQNENVVETQGLTDQDKGDKKAESS